MKTYHRTYPEAPVFAQNRIGYKDESGVFIETMTDGDPVDIPADQFVSVRVEMPSDSIGHQKMSAIQAESDSQKEEPTLA